MKIRFAAWGINVALVVLGLLLVSHDVVLATNPVTGSTHSFDGAIGVRITADGVHAIVVGDVDNDGYADLVYAAGSALAIVENGGSALDDWPTVDVVDNVDSGIAEIALADFDRDGWTDVAGVTEGSGSNMVRLWQNPTGVSVGSWVVSNTLTNSMNISVTSLAVADLDADGSVDLITGGSDGLVRLWINPLTATAPFSTSWGTPFSIAAVGAGINDLAVTDIDRDGRVDVVAAAGGIVRILRNPGSSSTTSWTVSNTLDGPPDDVVSVILSDLDGDGWRDVAVGDAAGNLVVWRNPLTVTAPFTASWGAGVDVGDAAGVVNDLFVGDLDNDGDVDLVSASGSSVQTWQNDGAPFGRAWVSTMLGTRAETVYAVTAADMDHDGDVDVASGGGLDEEGEIVLWPNALLHRSLLFEEPGYIVGAQQDVRYRDILSVDLDSDGDLDLITGGDGNGGYVLTAWENVGTPFDTGWIEHVVGDLGVVYSVAVGDLDGDGDRDIITGVGPSPQLLVWENDGTPFEGSWDSYSVGSVPASVSDLAAGDLDRDGDLDIVAVTGVTQQSPTSAFRVMVWRNDGDPFVGMWGSSDAYIVTYSVNSVALGDLDNDGWLDIVVGVDHAPVVGTSIDPAPPEDWHPNYELRAYRNDGTPFVGTWTQTNVGRDPETETFESGRYHGYWGATVFSVALADLDNDGDLDIVSTDHLEGDYQIKVWENDGTPFDGQPEWDHGTWRPTAVYVEAPWMASSVYDVTTGDVNTDGFVDLITGSGEFYETVVWENDGRPFSSIISDTTWVRHNLGQYTLEDALSVTVGDFDRDGDLDIAQGGGEYWSSAGDHHVVAWLNQSGSVRVEARSIAPGQIWEGDAEAALDVSVAHGGISTDHDVELSEWRLLLEESPGDPLTSSEANAIIENLYLYLDQGDSSWQEALDTRVLTITELSLTDGFQSLTFADGDPVTRIGPGDGTRTFFVVIEATPDASSRMPSVLTVTFDPDSDSIVQDRSTDASVSIQDTVPVGIGPVTLVGPASRVVIEDQPTASGSHVGTATLGSGVSFTVYANSRDPSGGFCHNAAVAWSLIDVMGGVGGADLVPASDNRSATFTAHGIGATRILAHHPTLADDTTGMITVTLGITATPNPAIVGETGGAVVTAALVEEDLTPVADGTVVTFTTGLGSFDGAASVTRTTVSGVATATLTSVDLGTATVTVKGDAGEGWADVAFVPGEPRSVTLQASPTRNEANCAAISTIAASLVDQYDHPVVDGTVVTFTASVGSFPTNPYTRTTIEGVATAVLTLPAESTTSIATATSGAAIGTVEVTLTPGEPDILGLTVIPLNRPVGDDIAVTAAVSDRCGSAVADGTPVTFTISLDLGSGSFLPATGFTAGGVATSTLTSSVTGRGVLTATTSGGIDETAIITFTPGGLGRFQIAAPTAASSGVPFSATVTAYDIAGNLKADYSGMVVFESTDVSAALPADDGTGWVDGARAFTLTLSTSGNQVFTVTHGMVVQSVAVNVQAAGAAQVYQVFLPLVLQAHH